MKNNRARIALLCAPLLVAAGTAPARAGGVVAGTLIENTATASFDAGGSSQTVDSNTVTLRVDELLDVTVTSLDPGPVTSRPGSAVLTFEVTNTGNGPEAFRLTANPSVAGNDFDATIEGIAVDTNGNGIFDRGVDTILSGPETTDVINPDAILTVFVLLNVPAGALDTQTSDVDLLAQAVTGTGAPGSLFAGQGVGGTDAVVGTTGADANQIGSLLVVTTAVTLTKSAVVVDPFGGTSTIPGAIITYSIRATVSGSGSVDNLVITDAFPAGTTYRSGTLQLDSVALSDGAGDDAGEADASGVTVDLQTVTGGTTRVVQFAVSID